MIFFHATVKGKENELQTCMNARSLIKREKLKGTFKIALIKMNDSIKRIKIYWRKASFNSILLTSNLFYVSLQT